MTVFEDLIVELKEENLLEETVISVDSPAGSGVYSNGSNDEHDFAELIDAEPSFDEASLETGAAIVGNEPDQVKPTASSSLHKFAAEQVSTYQMVEHIFTSIESNRLNRETSSFDELRAKKSLHDFQQASADPSSMEYAEAEAQLGAQVSAWKQTLEARDADISVSMMRRYCETCQPALSAQALFSLARFYRSLPYTESSRGKFEFIVTRLFSRRSNGERRTLICQKEEMLGHLRSRFRDPSDRYSNIPRDDADLMLAVLTFDDFTGEAGQAESFDELIDTDFFKRLYQFKEFTGKGFFAPTVTAAAIASNISIGNKLAEMLDGERLANNGSRLLQRHASLRDENISIAVGRTLELEVMLRAAPVEEEVEEVEEEEEEEEDAVHEEYFDHELVEVKRDAPPKPVVAKNQKKSEPRFAFRLAGVNRWLLATTVLVVILSISLYVWANNYADSVPVSKDVISVDMVNSPFKDLVKEGRISGDTFYGITLPAWDALTKEGQQEVLQKLLKTGTEKKYRRVSLINPKGQTVGYAVDGRTDVFRQ